jgi:predicted dehydrogenase
VRQVIDKVRTDGLLETYRTVRSRLDRFAPLGYSTSGVVLEVGEGVEEFSVGDQVACAGAGFANHAEIVFVPRNLVVKLPDGVTTSQAAYSAVGAIALQGIRRAELTPGETVGVIGLGLIGQLTVQILRAYGFPVLGLDIAADKVEEARQGGIEEAGVIDAQDIEALASSFTSGYGLDAVIITAATPDSGPIELAGQILRERGRVSAVGDVGLDVPRRVFYPKELDLRISRSYGPGRYDTSYEEHGIDYPLPFARWTEGRNMAEFLRLAGTGRVDIDRLTTHTFAVEQADEAYQLILDGPGDNRMFGVILEYPSGDAEPERRIDLPVVQRKRKTGEVRVGLIGAGSFARGVILPALKAAGDVNVRAVSSAQGASARDLANSLGADYATSEYMEIVNDPNIDLIISAARHDVNNLVGVAALKVGKSVHIEKPLALTRDQLSNLVDAARTSSGILAVGFNRRYAPATLALKKHFAGRHTPLLMHYRVNAGFIPADSWVHDPVEGGGRILGEVCHFVDLLQHLVGAPPTRVSASRLQPHGDAILADDNMAAIIEFADGSVGTIGYSALGADQQPKEFIDVMGAGRSALIENFRRLELYGDRKPKKTSNRLDKGHNAQFAALLTAVKGGGEPPIPFDQLVLSTVATMAIVESLQTGEPVAVDVSDLAIDRSGK